MTAAPVHYRIFDVCVRSEIPLPGLPQADDSEAQLSVRLGQDRLEAAGFEPVHEWKSAAGGVFAACLRRADDYCLHFPGLADFLFHPRQGMITVYPAPGASAGTTAHLAMDQAIPRLLGHLGHVVMHASAVLLPDGRAIGFFGDTGHGKSTLAASFYRAGLELISDDCLQLECRDGGVTALAAYPSLRLWPASASQIFEDTSGFESVAHYSNKRQLIFAGLPKSQAAARPLAALFVLGDPSAAPSDGMTIEPMGGAEAAMALIEAAFVLDVGDRQAARQNFLRVAQVADAGVPVYRLDYPRRFDSLAEVRDGILRRVQA